MPVKATTAHRLAKLVKRARRRMTNVIRERLVPLGSSLPIVHVLRRLVEEGELSQLELARESEVEPAALHRLVVELEARGLVARRRDAVDKRRVLVAATRAGAADYARTHPAVLAAIESVAARLSRAEQAELCRLLEKLAEDDDAKAAEKRLRAS